MVCLTRGVIEETKQYMFNTKGKLGGNETSDKSANIFPVGIASMTIANSLGGIGIPYSKIPDMTLKKTLVEQLADQV